MSNKLIKWNTARKIKEKIQELTFLKNFEIAPEKQASYVKFTNYVRENYREVEFFGKTSAEVSSGYNSMISHVDKVESFQTFVTNGATNEAIAEVAKQLFGTDSVTEACVIDYELYKEFLDLLEWGSSISVFLNKMNILTRETGLPSEFEAELRWYCSQKGVI
jgi:deoxyhypusine synthase